MKLRTISGGPGKAEPIQAKKNFTILHFFSRPLNGIVDIYSQFLRSRQLGDRVPAFRLGVPPRYKANKLAAVSCSSNGAMLGGVGFWSGTTGKPGRAWHQCMDGAVFADVGSFNWKWCRSWPTSTSWTMPVITKDPSVDKRKNTF